MRMLTLEIWNKWRKLRLHLGRPRLSLDSTNNASERGIGKSKVRYKSRQGHKITEGMKNAIALTQLLYSGEKEHDLSRRWRPKTGSTSHRSCFSNLPTVYGTVTRSSKG
jgi:hypothetical protein